MQALRLLLADALPHADLGVDDLVPGVDGLDAGHTRVSSIRGRRTRLTPLDLNLEFLALPVDGKAGSRR